MTKGSEGKGSNPAGHSGQKITRSQTGESVATQALDEHVSVPGSGLTAVTGASALTASALSYNPSVSTHSPVMTTTTITSSTNTHTFADPCTSADRDHLSSGVSLSSDNESGFRMFEDAGKRQSRRLPPTPRQSDASQPTKASWVRDHRDQSPYQYWGSGVRPKATSMAQSSQLADNDDKGIMRELITVLNTVMERLPVPVNDQHDNGESKNTPYTGPQRKTVPTSELKKISSGRRQDLRTQKEVSPHMSDHYAPRGTYSNRSSAWRDQRDSRPSVNHSDKQKSAGRTSKPSHSRLRKMPTVLSESDDMSPPRRRHSQRIHCSSYSSDFEFNSCTDSPSDIYSEASSHKNERTAVGRYHRDSHSRNVRLPPFTGKEPWKVYFNRFEDVARLEGWSETTKLRELLPRLQGQAGEFVYEQLSGDVRSNFRRLVRELKHRYRKVETTRTYSAQFSNRIKKSGESVENYAADLKRLYDKALANRDRSTRREDLLRRFLDGILDEGARFQVEYVKEPKHIDAAVYEVVNFVDTRKRSAINVPDSRHRPAREVHEATDLESMQSYSGGDVRSAHKQKHGARKQTGGNADKHSGKPPQSNPVQNEDNSILKRIEDLLLQQQQPPQGNVSWGKTYPDKQPWSSQAPRLSQRPGACYRCGGQGHYARECQSNWGGTQLSAMTPSFVPVHTSATPPNQIDSNTELRAVEVPKTNTSVTIGSNSTVCSTPLSAEPEVKVVEVSRSVSTLDMPVIRGEQHAQKDAKVPCMLYVVTLLSNLLCFPFSWLKKASSSFFTTSGEPSSLPCNPVVNEGCPQKNIEPNTMVPLPKSQRVDTCRRSATNDVKNSASINKTVWCSSCARRILGRSPEQPRQKKKKLVWSTKT